MIATETIGEGAKTLERKAQKGLSPSMQNKRKQSVEAPTSAKGKNRWCKNCEEASYNK